MLPMIPAINRVFRWGCSIEDWFTNVAERGESEKGWSHCHLEELWSWSVVDCVTLREGEQITVR